MRRDTPAVMRSALLDWYDREGRSLPWRIRPEERAQGVVADPYAVWLSEIMLQQTTVPHALPYWQRFLERWPTVGDLAKAERDAVMAAWAGLGYYARARNMHACAQRVAFELQGRFPSDLAELKALPGVGEYTANAIRAAAFDLPASVVDGNVERVITRVFAMETPLPKAKPLIKAEAARLASPDRPGDYAQAIMDLGAVVCTPRAPACTSCPWQPACAAFASGRRSDFPRKLKKKIRPVRYGSCFHLTRRQPDGELELLLRRRPDSGLLGGMMELPGTDWTEGGGDQPARRQGPPIAGEWRHAGEVRHIFTHFQLELAVWAAVVEDVPTELDGEWIPVRSLGTVGLPSVMMKAAKAGLARTAWE